MVSNADADSEGWPLVEALLDETVCSITDLLGPVYKEAAEPSQQLLQDEQQQQQQQLQEQHEHDASIKHKLPTVVHYSQQYRVGTYMWSKWQAKLQGMFACDQPYLQEPPDYLGTMRAAVSATRIRALYADLLCVLQ
jgi:hypothetical protein